MNRSRVTGDLASHGNIFVDIANDRVGIGSTIPTNKLDIRGIVESRSAIHFHESTWTGETTKIQLQSGFLHIEGGSNGTIFRRVSGGNCWSVTSDGHFQVAVDSTFDIGTNAARVRNIYADTLYGDGSNLTGIANGNIASNAAIAGSKIANDSITATQIANDSITVNELANNSVGNSHIIDGTIYNAEINGSAAIAGTKINPNFGAQNIQTTGQLQLAGALPTILLNDENNENDFEIRNENGNFKVRDIDNPQDRYVIASSGMIHTFHGTASFSSNLDVGAGIDVAGASTFTGNVTLSSVTPQLNFVDTNHDPDYAIWNHNGTLRFLDTTNSSATRLEIQAGGLVKASNSFEVTGSITGSANLTIGGEINLIGSSDAAKYIDARVGTSNNLNFRSTSGGDSNHVTMMSLNTSGASIIGDLVLGDGTADSAAGPEFKLNRNSASPANADYLGQIKFAGRSSTGVERNYAKITGKILDVTNGAEDGILEFAHIKNGSQVITGRFRSDSLQLLNGTQLTVAGTTTLNSPVTINTSTDKQLILSGASSPYISFEESSTAKAYIQWNAAGHLELRNSEDDSTLYIKDALTFQQSVGGTQHTIWHSGNDGSGSGLDADTLDSIGSGSFLRSDAADSASGSISFTSSYYEFGNSTGSVSNDGGWHARVNLAGTQHARLDVKSVSDGIITTLYSHTGHTSGKVGTRSNHALSFITNNTTRATLSTAGSLETTVQGTLWGASNDGSGSGLDADTLDSVQGSSFLRSDATDTCSGQITHTNKVIIDHNSSTMLELKPQNSSPWVIGINRDDLDQSRVFVHNANGLGWVFEHRPKFYNSGSYDNFLTTGDEGSGNGLDADTVDGFQTSQAGGASKVLVSQSNGYLHIDNWIRVAQESGLFVQSGQHLFSGPNSSYKSWRNRSDDANACGIGLESSQGTVRAWVYANSSQVGFLRPDNEDWRFRVENTGITKLGSNGYQFINGNNSRNLYFISGDSGSGTDIGISGFNGANQWRFQLYGAASGYGFLDANWNSWDIKKVPSGNFEVDEGSGLARVWNSLNDGSGSGLDADTVDGTHVAELVTTNTTQTIAATKTFNLSGYDINLDYDNVRNLVRIQRQGTEKFMLGAAGNEIKINTSNSGFLSFGTSLLPQNDGSVDLGSSSKRWANLYTADAHFSNVGTGGNDIDGTEGSWTLQEAEDNIYMINKKNGKRYKIKMEEV